MTAEPAADAAYRSGVGIMLLSKSGQVFVAKRIDMPSDAWQMPQGGIDADETPAAAARRELKEETGTDRADIVAESRDWYRYDLPAELRKRLWSGKYRGQRQKWFVMRFTGRDRDIDLATEHPEFSDWKWIAPATLPDLIVPFKRPLYRALLVEFKDLLNA